MNPYGPPEELNEPSEVTTATSSTGKHETLQVVGVMLLFIMTFVTAISGIMWFLSRYN